MVSNLWKKLKDLLPRRDRLKTALFVQPMAMIGLALALIFVVTNLALTFFVGSQVNQAIQNQFDRLNSYYIGGDGTTSNRTSVFSTTYIILDENFVSQYRSTHDGNRQMLEDSVQVLAYFYDHQEEQIFETSSGQLSVQRPVWVEIDGSTYIVKLQPYYGELDNYRVIQSQSDTASTYYIMVFSNITPMLDVMTWLNIFQLLLMLAVGLVTWLVIYLTSRQIDLSFAQLKTYITQVGNREKTLVLDRLPFEEFNQVGDSVRTMSQMLESNQRSQELFFQNSSHELRTPLMSIQGYAEGIKEGVIKDYRGSAEIILAESRKMAQLVDEILTISKLETVQDSLELEEIQLTNFLYDLTWQVKPRADERSLTLVHDLEPDLVLQADETLLERALTNILTNAVRYAQSTIWVSSHRQETGFAISISNDGPPISAGDLPRIFDRFYKGQGGQFGIGLAMAKDIVQRHGGHILVQSNQEKTTFTLKFP